MTHPAPVYSLAPMLHVADVAASVHFYSQLGLIVANTMRDHAGRPFWASMTTPTTDPAKQAAAKPLIMFTAASGPVDPLVQAVIIYLYSKDVATLRTQLLSQGLQDGHTFRGNPPPTHDRNVAFTITHPHYMPNGELRLADPDGYCLLIGQQN